MSFVVAGFLSAGGGGAPWVVLVARGGGACRPCRRVCCWCWCSSGGPKHV